MKTLEEMIIDISSYVEIPKGLVLTIAYDVAKATIEAIIPSSPVFGSGTEWDDRWDYGYEGCVKDIHKRAEKWLGGKDGKTTDT